MSVREVALAKKGTFATVEYSKEVKTLKGCPVTITKKTIARNVRIGCEYDSLKVVKDARGVKTTKESREKSSGLNGFEWVNFPRIRREISLYVSQLIAILSLILHTTQTVLR